MRGESLPRRLHADQLNRLILEERGEHSNRVRTPAHTCHDRARQPTELLERLRPRLATDDRLEIADKTGKWIGSDHGADDIVRGRDIRDPIAQCLVCRVFQGARARRHGYHLRAHQLHPIHIEPLAPRVFLAHVDDAVEAEARAHRGSRDAMLTGARLRDDPALLHSLREEDLSQRVVDLVGAGVVQVFALQQDARANSRRQPRHGRDRCRAADVVLEQRVELAPELRIVARRIVHARQFLERMHQRFGDVSAAIGAESTGFDRRHVLPVRRTPTSALTACSGSACLATLVPTSTKSAPADASRSTSVRVLIPLSATTGTLAGIRAINASAALRSVRNVSRSRALMPSIAPSSAAASAASNSVASWTSINGIIASDVTILASRCSCVASRILAISSTALAPAARAS